MIVYRHFHWRFLFLLLVSIIEPIGVFAHKNWEAHAKDIMNVFGLEFDGRKAPKNKDIKEQWIKFISSDMIDNKAFHKELSNRHKGFPNLGTPSRHRILFHWAYTAEPWNREFESIVRDYCETYDLNVESNIRIFKSELIREQSRRNKEINDKTANIFGFKEGGVERSFIRFFASIAYNVHILGDYMSDNTELVGLNELTDLMGMIIRELRDFDPQGSKEAIKELNYTLKASLDTQKKADKLMAILITHVPSILKNARAGHVYRRLINRGYKFK